MEISKKYRLKYVFLEALYWSSVCPVSGFMVAYMQSKGYSSTYLGIMMAVSNIVLAFLQPLIASAVDRSEKLTLRMVNVTFTLITLISCILMIVTDNVVWALTGVVTLAITTVNAMQPFTNAVSVELSEKGIDVNFGFCRAFGSLAYAITSTVTGKLMSSMGYDVMPYISIVILVLLLISCLIMDDGSKYGKEAVRQQADDKEEAKSLGRFLADNKKFCLFLLATICIFHTHMASNNYLINVVENVGGDSASQGVAASIGALCELPVMLLFSFLCSRFKVQNLIKLGGVFFVIKFILLTIGSSIPAIYAAEIFQGFSYAVLIPANVYYVGHLFSGADMNKGQSLSTAAMCVATVTASIIGGYFIDAYGVTTMMTVSTAISAVGVVILFLSLEEFKE